MGGGRAVIGGNRREVTGGSYQKEGGLTKCM